jgi:ribose-phosphate pyrophosphokinase
MLLKLDLVRPSGTRAWEGISRLKYSVSKFPDGQQGITLDGGCQWLNPDDEYEVISRLNSFSDLELILCATAALKSACATKISLNCPYFIGARSDRKFGPGGYHYLKDVIAPIINAQGFTSVTVLDPHSDVLEACIDRLKPVSNTDFVKWALADLGCSANPSGFNLVAPDAGAYKKVDRVARDIGYPFNIVTANKHRDLKTGQITGTKVDLSDAIGDNFIIIDDICDGGRTFIGIADAIREKNPKAKVYLLVTHGIFSAGFAQLVDRFAKIYTTNSYRDFSEDSQIIKSLDIF